MRVVGPCLLLAALCGALIQGCAPETMTVAFPQVGRIEGELKRGASTKTDVQNVLGAPVGKGNAVLPTDPRPREVWFYPDIEVTGLKVGDRLFGVLAPNWVSLRHQFLVVFFENELFDGFLWYSNVLDQERPPQASERPAVMSMGNFQYGWPPRTDPLGTLRVGVSSAADVLITLGEPRGNGAARFPRDRTPRQVWLYEQTHIEGWRIHLKILLVFLRDERYDGHMWFSTIEPPGQQR